MAAVTVWSAFWNQENKICHCFQFFFTYLPWSDGTRFHDLSFLCFLFLLMLSFKPSFSFCFLKFSAFWKILYVFFILIGSVGHLGHFILMAMEEMQETQLYLVPLLDTRHTEKWDTKRHLGQVRFRVYALSPQTHPKDSLLVPKCVIGADMWSCWQTLTSLPWSTV